jgi:hypothetical protein
MPHRHRHRQRRDAQSRQAQTTPVDPVQRPPLGNRGNGYDGGRSSSPAAANDWAELVRRLERKRRTLDRIPPGLGNGGASPAPLPLPDGYYVQATWSSFRLEGIDVEQEEVRDALAQTSGGGHTLRSRQCQRLRNHAAILHHVETDLRQNVPLSTDAVIRWYAGIGAGLSTTPPSHASSGRLEDQVRRINSPQLRLSAAIPEIAGVYVTLLADPLIPSFNGILARLLLRYHLGRCSLPAIVFDPARDAQLAGADAMARRLVELLQVSCDQISARRA